jgi:quinol monooxygenase YgiN
MTKKLKLALMGFASLVAALATTWAQVRESRLSTPPAVKKELPDWMRRGIPGTGHTALEPLIGSWRVHKSIHGTMGRSPNLPPIISDDITTRREWVADRHYIEDTTEGTVESNPYWRRGWLGYSSMDRRYEWVTIDSLNTTMMRYLGDAGSGERTPINMSGVFTDQGVVSEKTVGKPVGMRTVIRIENNDRHVVELYFTPPDGKEQLADRSVYTRVNLHAAKDKGAMPISLPKLPEPSPGETSPYCVIAIHRAKPGLADALEKRMLADIERTRAEPGALQFHIHRDRFDRNLFVIYEVWQNRDALRNHFEKPFVKDFVADSAEYEEGNMEVQWLTMASEYTAGR